MTKRKKTNQEDNHLNNAMTALGMGVLSLLIGFVFPLVWIFTLFCAYEFFNESNLHTEQQKRIAYEKEQERLAEQKRLLEYQTKQRELERQRQFELEKIKAQYVLDYQELGFKDWITYYGTVGVVLIISSLMLCIMFGFVLALLLGV